jgi:hypothetical protein
MFIDLLSYAWQHMETVSVEKLKLLMTAIALTLRWAITSRHAVPARVANVAALLR